MRFLLISLLALFHYALFAQRDCKLSISGHVLDEHNGEVLAFAEVYIPQAHTGAVVDSSGYYHIDGLCPGVYEVIVSHIGCLPVHRKISLTRSVDQFNFYPEHHTTALEEVQLFKPTKAEKIQTAQSLHTLPPSKVRLLQTGQSVVKPIVQGFNGNRVRVVKQGISIEDQQWGSDHGLSLMLYPDDQLAETSDPASSFSTLQFAANNPFEKKTLMFGNVFSNGRGGTLGFLSNYLLNNQLAMGTRAQLKRFGDLHTPNYTLQNTAGLEGNAQLDLALKQAQWRLDGSVVYNLQHFGILRASHTGNADDFKRALNASEPAYQRPFSYTLDYPRQQAQHFSTLLKAEKKHTVEREDFTTLVRSLSFHYSYQQNNRREYDIRRGGNSATPALNLQLQTHTGSVAWQGELAPNDLLSLELQQALGINTNIPGTGYAPVLPNYNQYNTTLKGSFQKKLEQNQLLKASLHVQHVTTLAQYFEGSTLLQPTFTFSTASGTLVYQTSKLSKKGSVLKWHSSAQLIQRAPAPNELLVSGVHHGTASIEEGNKNLQTETKTGLEQQLEWQTGHGFNLKVNAYGYYIHNYIYQLPQAQLRQTIRGAFPVFTYAQSNALFSGLEAQLKKEINTNLQYKGALNFIYAQDLSKHTPLPLIPPVMWSNELRLSYPLSNTWKEGFISIQHQYTGRQFRYNPQLDLAAPPADYSLFDLAIGLSLEKKHTYHFSLSVENLGNHAYRNYLDRFRYFANAPGRNLIVECLINF